MKRLSKLLSRFHKSKEKVEANEKDALRTLDEDVYGQSTYMNFSSSSFPVLPFEIWLDIIELACSSLVAPSSAFPDLFQTGSTYYMHREEDELASSQNTRNFQLVCRAWRVLVIKHAYERLVLCCERHMKLLLQTLEDSKERDPEGIGYGRWVREVETRRTACPCETADNPEKLKAELRLFAIHTIRILRRLPNLQIYINRNGEGLPLGLNTYRAVMETIGSHCGASLLRLQWAASESPRWDDLQLLLSKTPKLRSLSLLYVDFARTRGDGGSSGPPPERCSLPHLNHLHLGPFSFEHDEVIRAPYWDPLFEFLMPPRNGADPNGVVPLPALRALYITPLNLLSSHTSERFFTTYGAELDQLATSDLTPEQLQLPDGRILNLPVSVRTLPTLLGLCPNLQTLILDPLEPFQRHLQRLAHARLERVAFCPKREGFLEVPESVCKSLRQHVGDVFEEFASGTFPRLRVLRLRDRAELTSLGMEESREWAEDWQKKFEQRGIRFENGDGIRFMLTIEDSMEYMPDGI